MNEHMRGWSGQMNGWHTNAGWMPVSLIVVAGLVALVAWALLRAQRRR